jgi:hypothetical protein
MKANTEPEVRSRKRLLTAQIRTVGRRIVSIGICAPGRDTCAIAYQDLAPHLITNEFRPVVRMMLLDP